MLLSRVSVSPFSEDKVMYGISTCFKSVIESQPLSLSQLVQLAGQNVNEELLKALESSPSYKKLSFEEAEQSPCYRTSIKKRKVLALKTERLHALVIDDKVRRALLKEYLEEGVLLGSRDGKPSRQPPSGKTGVVLVRRYCFLIDELHKLTS